MDLNWQRPGVWILDYGVTRSFWRKQCGQPPGWRQTQMLTTLPGYFCSQWAIFPQGWRSSLPLSMQSWRWDGLSTVSCGVSRFTQAKQQPRTDWVLWLLLFLLRSAMRKQENRSGMLRVHHERSQLPRAIYVGPAIIRCDTRLAHKPCHCVTEIWGSVFGSITTQNTTSVSSFVHRDSSCKSLLLVTVQIKATLKVSCVSTNLAVMSLLL